MNKARLIEIKKEHFSGEFGAIMSSIIDALLEDDTPVPPAPAKTPKFFVPEIGQEYWFIKQFNSVSSTPNFNKETDIFAISLGVYSTEEECTQAFEKQKALVRLWKNADEKYFFRPDWGDSGQQKFTIKYDHPMQTWTSYHWTIFQENFSLPYFATQEDAENFIKENKNNLEIYCIDK